VQYDLTLRDAIAQRYFYVWRDRWSFRTAKTLFRHGRCYRHVQRQTEVNGPIGRSLAEVGPNHEQHGHKRDDAQIERPNPTDCSCHTRHKDAMIRVGWPTRLAALSIGALLAMFSLTAIARAADPIRIGFGIGLTGGVAANGKAALIAFQMWAEEVNAKGGLLDRKVEFIYYDDQSNPSRRYAFILMRSLRQKRKACPTCSYPGL
jgi:hypothetical protein